MLALWMHSRRSWKNMRGFCEPGYVSALTRHVICLVVSLLCSHLFLCNDPTWSNEIRWILRNILDSFKILRCVLVSVSFYFTKIIFYNTFAETDYTYCYSHNSAMRWMKHFQEINASLWPLSQGCKRVVKLLTLKILLRSGSFLCCR